MTGNRDEQIRRRKIILENLDTEKTQEQLTKIVYPEFKKINLEKASPSEKKEFRHKGRNINNDLNYLRRMKFIDNYKTRGTYQKVGIKTKDFQSKTELDMAIIHAKHIIFEENFLVSLFGAPSIVDSLAFEGSNDLLNRKQILDHVKTGYPEIYEKMKEYEKLVKESGYIPNCLKPKPIQPPALGSLEMPKHIVPLKEELVEKFDSEIMKTVKEGQPLLGECEQCPSKRFKISK